jgi:hypothetical protein
MKYQDKTHTCKLENIRKQNIKAQSCTMRYRRFTLWFTWIMLSYGILRSVPWLRVDVSGLRIGPIFKGRNVLLFRHLDPWRWDRYTVPKRRCETNLRCVTSQKTTDFIKTQSPNSHLWPWKPLPYSLQHATKNEARTLTYIYSSLP